MTGTARSRSKIAIAMGSGKARGRLQVRARAEGAQGGVRVGTRMLEIKSASLMYAVGTLAGDVGRTN